MLVFVGQSRRTCSATELDEVYQALLTHQVIFLDDQTLSPKQHLMIAERFGHRTSASVFLASSMYLR
ncbi:TauD/TfdA family dioxygenase [Vibrio lentus]|nr:TauD/TfdA family dioxygenase [Vibrio lentus]